MADISFSCPNCGQVLEAPEDMAGQAVECPACQQQIEIPVPEVDPAPAEAGEAATDDAATDDDASDGAATEDVAATDESDAAHVCPSCKEPMDPGAVLCMNCGYHCKLGKKIETSIG